MQRFLPRPSNNELLGFEERLSLCSTLIQRTEVDDEDIYFIFMCGKQAMIDERFEEAIDYLSQVISLFMKKPIEQIFTYKLGKKIPYDELINSYILRGNAYFAINKETLSIKDYTSCIEIDNTHFDSYRNRAVCFINEKQFENAISDLLVIARNKEYCPEIHRLLGLCYKFTGEHQKSILHFSISTKQGENKNTKPLDNDKF